MTQRLTDLAVNGRLLYTSPVDLAAATGPAVNEREFLRGLYDHFGTRVTALIPRPTRPLDDFRGLRAVFTGRPPLTNARAFAAYQFELMTRGVALARRGAFNLIVIRPGLLPVGQHALTRLAGIPYVLKTIGAGNLDPLSAKGGRLGRMAAPFNRRLLRGLVRDALVVDVCTEQMCSYVGTALGSRAARFSVVANVTNVHRFVPGDTHQARRELGLERFGKIVGFAGGAPRERGGMQIVEALPQLLQHHPDLGAVVVGDGPGTTGLAMRARQLGVDDRVVLPGVVPYEHVPRYLQTFDVGIALDTGARLAAIGNSSQKIRQYLACGLPVVCGAVGNDFVTEEAFGLAVAPDDIRSFVRAVRQLLQRDTATAAVARMRAIEYARRNLSVEWALERRLALWQLALADRVGAPA